MSELRRIDSLRLHPDAERVPVPDAADLARLQASLQENGQEDPIDVTADGVILDGRTRWTVLQRLGARTITVRVVDLPERDQTAYIIDRALARRHLTMAQKQVLNALLRDQIIEVRQPSQTSVDRGVGPMRMGYSQTERAEKLGVDRKTVQNWDDDPLVGEISPTRPSPTHAVDKRGRPQPIHRARAGAVTPKREATRPEPRRKSRPIPTWSRHFSTWCRGARPEDRDFLRRLDREVRRRPEAQRHQV